MKKKFFSSFVLKYYLISFAIFKPALITAKCNVVFPESSVTLTLLPRLTNRSVNSLDPK